MPIRVSNVTSQILFSPAELFASGSDTLSFTEEPFARKIRVSNATFQVLQYEITPVLGSASNTLALSDEVRYSFPAEYEQIKGCVYFSGFFRCFHPIDPTHPANYIPFQQEVSLVGSDWSRSVESVIEFTQSDYFIEALSDPITFSDEAIGVRGLNETVNDPMTLSDADTISGGRFVTTVSETAIFDSTTLKGMAVYVVSEGHVDLAQADALATAGAIGLAHLDVAASTVGTYITEGLVTRPDWTAVTGTANLTPGALYYLSTATAGALTSTAPTTTGDILVSIGRAASQDTLDVSIRNPIVL